MNTGGLSFPLLIGNDNIHIHGTRSGGIALLYNDSPLECRSSSSGIASHLIHSPEQQVISSSISELSEVLDRYSNLLQDFVAHLFGGVGV